MFIFSHYTIKYHKGVILFLISWRFLSFFFCFYSLLFSLPLLISSFFSFISKFLSNTLSRVLEIMLKEKHSFYKQVAQSWDPPAVQEARGPSLIREPRSHMLHSQKEINSSQAPHAGSEAL